MVFDKIMIPLKKELLLAEKLDEKRRFKKYYEPIHNMTSKREKYLEYLQNATLEYFDNSRCEASPVKHGFYKTNVCLRLIIKVTTETDECLVDDTFRLLFDILAMVLSVTKNTGLDNITHDFFVDICFELESILNKNTDDEIITATQHCRFIRELYRAYFELSFDPTSSNFSQTMDSLLRYCRKLAANDSEWVLKLNSDVLYIALDFAVYKEAGGDPFLSEEEINTTAKDLLESIKKRNDDVPHLALEACVRLYHYLFFCSRKEKNIVFKIIYKKLLFEFAGSLVDIFYDHTIDPALLENISLLLDAGPQALKDSYRNKNLETLPGNFSTKLAKVINDTKQNTTAVLFPIYEFLAMSPEYVSLCKKIYTKLYNLLITYRDRKLLIHTVFYYLQLLNDFEIFKKYIVSIKREIESRPVTSYITYFNALIDRTPIIKQEQKPIYKIDIFITKIQKHQAELNKEIIEKTSAADPARGNSLPDEMLLNNLANFRNEIKNMFTLARDTLLIRDMGRMYCFFIDAFVNKEGYDYRVDMQKRATAVKMQAFDINPYHFAVLLMYVKTGKLSLIMEGKKEIKNSIRKKKLTELEKQKIAGYIPRTLQNLPTYKKGINWNAVKAAITSLRAPAMTQKSIAPLESRILKIVSALINKMTRQDIDPWSLFSALYDESYAAAKKEWDLDPIILFYFNAYFARKGKLALFAENTGEKMEMHFKLLNNALINEKINEYIKLLLAKTKPATLDLTSEIQKIGSFNKIEAYKDDKLVNMTEAMVSDIVHTQKTVSLRLAYIHPDMQHYVLHTISLILRESSSVRRTAPVRFICTQFIDFFNTLLLFRMYAKLNQLDMEQRYEMAVKSWKQDKDVSKGDLAKIARSKGYKTEIKIQVFKGQLIFSINANWKLLQDEVAIIHEYVQLSRKINSVNDAVAIYKTQKSAIPHGLIIALFMLKKMGVEKTAFRLNHTNENTSLSLQLPITVIEEELRLELAKEISNHIHQLPSLPAQIYRLKKTLDDPDVELSVVEAMVKQNPAVLTVVLKTANSPMYIQGQKATTVRDAIQLIGLRKLKVLILVTGSFRVLKERQAQKRYATIYRHCELTAYYANQIIKKKNLNINSDYVYFAALLHDIGKLVIEGLNKDFYNSIRELLDIRGVNDEVLEDASGGMNHALIGYELAKKWGFPQSVATAIGFHHDPAAAPEHRDEVFTAYMANALTHYNNDDFMYENFEQEVLGFFDITNKKELDSFAAQIRKNYRQFLLQQT